MSLLHLDKVAFIPDGQTVLQDISFDVDQGEFVTITGPSGSGKSTILKIIASLLTPTSGMIDFEKQSIATLDPIDYRREVSYCFQQPSLFGQTVKDNLIFPFEIREQQFDQVRAENLLQEVDLPTDYLNKKITELSGGEKQRVALIRNLMFAPKVLLLDEVTAGLDEESKTIVQHLIVQKLQEGTTMIQVTHDHEEIETAQRVIQIVAGKVASDERISSK